jgi:hypothetical protein
MATTYENPENPENSVLMWDESSSIDRDIFDVCVAALIIGTGRPSVSLVFLSGACLCVCCNRQVSTVDEVSVR